MNQTGTVLDFPEVTFVDDLDIAHNPEEYKDPALPLPLMAGIYGVTLSQTGFKRTRDEHGQPTDTLVLVKNDAGTPTYPVIEVKQITVAKAGDAENLVGRKVYPFQEFGTKTTTKKDWNAGGQEYDFNYLNAIIRSHDATLPFRGLNEALDLFKRVVADNGIFFVRLDWKAEDRAWVREQIKVVDAALAAGEISEEDAKKRRSEIRYKQGQQEGIAKFKDKETGALSGTWTGPSGDEIEARVFIREFISTAQLSKFKLGPRKV